MLGSVFGLINALNVLKSACVHWSVLVTEMMACLIPMIQKIISATTGFDANEKRPRNDKVDACKRGKVRETYRRMMPALYNKSYMPALEVLRD